MGLDQVDRAGRVPPVEQDRGHREVHRQHAPEDQARDVRQGRGHEDPVVGPQPADAGDLAGLVDQGAVAVQDALGLCGRARGVEQQRDVVTGPRGGQPVARGRRCGVTEDRHAPGSGHVGAYDDQCRRCPTPGGHRVDERAGHGQVVVASDGAGDHEHPRAGLLEDEADLVCAIDRHDGVAHRPGQRAAVEDDLGLPPGRELRGDAVAGRDAQADERPRERLRVGEQLAVAERDVILDDGRTVGPRGGRLHQQPGQALRRRRSLGRWSVSRGDHRPRRAPAR